MLIKCYATMVRFFSFSFTKTDRVWITVRFVPLLTVCTVWLCRVLCRVTLSVLCHIARAVPLCPTVLYSSPAVLCSMLCMSIPHAGGGWLVMADSGRF